MKRKAMPRLSLDWEISAVEGAREEEKASAAVCGRAMLTRWASSSEGNLLTQPPMHLWRVSRLALLLLCYLGRSSEGNKDLPDTASDTLVFEQPQQVIRPLLKVLVDDLGDFWVVGNLGIEGFAGDGVDVCDELVFDG